MNCGDDLHSTSLPEDPKLKGDALTRFLKDLFSQRPSVFDFSCQSGE